MKFQLGLSPAAAADIDDAALYIASKNLPAGLRFYDAVDITIRDISQHPRRWPVFESNVTDLQDLRKRGEGFSQLSHLLPIRRKISSNRQSVSRRPRPARSSPRRPVMACAI